jgi:hypothetical protein
MYYGMSGLGADEGIDPTKSTIRWWCWDYPGFKDCHSVQWQAARAFCLQTGNSGYTSMDVCINKETDVRAKMNCECPSKSPAEPSKRGSSSNLGTYVLGFSFLALVGVVIYRSRKE